jgi:hypothetical protein
VTIRYEEREARASTVLRRTPSPSCSCGCHTNGKSNGHGGCGCGCGGGTKTANGTYHYATYSSAPTATATAAARQASALTMGACEPTRIIEGFRLDVCEGEDGLCKTPLEAIEGSLLWEIVECVSELYTHGRRRVPKRSYKVLGGALFEREATASPEELYEAYAHVRQGLYEWGARQPRCDIAEKLDRIVLQTPPTDEGDYTIYKSQAQVAIQSLVAVVWSYIVGCLCQRLLPTCPPDPCDDRLILACLTIVDGKIVSICNYGCRTYAGSWPTFNRWLSLVPVLPLLGVLLEYLCCLDWYRPEWGRKGNRLMAAVEHIDPTYSRARLYESDFSQLHGLLAGFRRVRDNLSAANLPAAVSDPRGFAEIVRSAWNER